ncbi:MAG: ABC transporter permease [Chloroflexi bacterium]|nr:ABC transporter permease [Chloroflexota bacterium]
MWATQRRKILRDIWSRKARTALVSISIFIGVLGVVTLFTMGDLLVRQLEDDLDQAELAMVRAFVDVQGGSQVDDEVHRQVFAELRALPDVTTVEAQAVFPGSWRKRGATEFETSSVFAYSEDFDAIQIEPMKLHDGRYPTPDENEIAVERRFADKHGLAVNDVIEIRLLGESQGNGDEIPVETWTIVGTVFSPYGYEGGFTPPLPEDMIFAHAQDAQRITGSVVYSSFYARYRTFALGESHAGEVEAIITSTTPYITIFSRMEDPAQNSRIEFSRTIGNVLASLGILALLVSGFLVVNVINSIITEQKRQIGVMKSLGATAIQNFQIYSGTTLVYGIIGVLPGVLLGIPFGFFAAQGLAEQSGTLIETFDVSWRAVLLGTVMGLAVPVVASLVPVFNGIRVRIFEALTDLGIEARYGGRMARVIERVPVPINLRQGISNVFRKRWRMAFTVLTLTVAAGAFMGVFAVFASTDKVLNAFFESYNFNFAVVPRNAEDTPQLHAILIEDHPDLKLIERGDYTSIAIEIDGYDREYDPNTGPPALFATGYDPASKAYDFPLEEGVGLDVKPEGVVVNRGIAQAMGVKAGDRVTIRASGREGTYELAGIADFPYDFVWFSWETLSVLAGFVDEENQPQSRGLLLSIDEESPSADEVADMIEQVDKTLLERGITADYTNIELFKEQITEGVGVFRLLFNFTALLIALVGAVGLMTTLSMSIYERQKEIGVMRSIGAGSLTIVTQFLTEGLVVGVLAWLIGIPLSYGLSLVLIEALDFGAEYQLSYPPSTILLGLVGTLVVTTIASIWPSVAAARKTVSDILRYQ